jgi:hypothetical protein
MKSEEIILDILKEKGMTKYRLSQEMDKPGLSVSLARGSLTVKTMVDMCNHLGAEVIIEFNNQKYKIVC